MAQWQARQRSLAQRENITAISILIMLNYYLGKLYGSFKNINSDLQSCEWNALWLYF